MTTPRLTTAAVLTALLAVPVGARAASSPLLSGYGAPGSSDQTMLGKKLLPPKPTSGGTGGGPTSGPASLRATVPTPAPAPVAHALTPTSSHPASPTHHTATTTVQATPAVTLPAAPLARRTPQIALPASAPGDRASTGLLPISTHDAWLGLLVILILAGIAVTTARLGRPARSAGARGPASAA